MEDDLRFTRSIAAAAALGNSALDGHWFMNKHVLLTGEPDVLETYNGRECLLSSLLLTIRICKNATLFLPGNSFELLANCKSILDHVALNTSVEFAEIQPDFHDYDAILSVGVKARPDLPWTVIKSDGWVVHVSSGPTNLCPGSSQSNPIGALAAASLGVSEVFKRLLKVKESRAKPFDGLSFSLYSYRCGDTDVGPPLPERLPLGVLLVGVGAIGNGVIHLLDLLPIDGFVWIVDVQTFQPENLGTCLLIGLPELGKEKAAFAEALLRKKVDARGFSEDLVSFADRLGKKIPYPAITVNALDNIPARHAVQNLWPDMIIDGAIGDFACQVSRHPWGEDVACLRCLFYEPTESADLIASRTSGLSRERTQQPFERVTDEDVQVAVDGRKEWLRARIGRQICSVVQEAVAEQISQEHQAERFQPSVPFVACLSASMIISELVKHLCGWPTPLAPRFQLDVLRGPKFGEEFPEKRRRDCICVTRKRNIDIFRRTRGHSF